MTGVVSVSEKAGQPVRCVLGRRTRVNRGRRVESELDVIETGLGCLARDKRKRCLLTACVVTGMYTACAQYWLVCGTWEPTALMRRKKSKWRTHEDERTDARRRGGWARSSDEAW